MTTPRFQKPTDKNWQDEQGTILPFNRLTKSEKLKERKAEKLHKKAMAVFKMLESLKAEVDADSREAMAETYKENNQDPEKGKGNFTWYNLDRSFKIEMSVQQRIDFDETLIELAKNKINEFLEASVSTNDDFVKQFVIDAFSKSKGTLDAKKVMSLQRYRSKVKNPLFHEALNLLDKSIRHPDSKVYFRLWVRNEQGEYEAINLNFSNI